MFLYTYIRSRELDSSPTEIWDLFITLYFDILNSVKSHNLNYKQCQQAIKKLYGMEPKDIIIQ